MRKRLKMFAAVLSLCVSLSSLPVEASGLAEEDSVMESGEISTENYGEEGSSIEHPEEDLGSGAENSVEDESQEETPEEGTISNEGTSDEGTVSGEGSSDEGTVSNEGSSDEGTVSGEGSSDEGTVSGEGSSDEGTVSGEGAPVEGPVNNEGMPETPVEGGINNKEIPAEGDGNIPTGSAAEALEGYRTDQNISSEFFYTQDFSDLGVRVSVHAVNYAIPAGADVQIAAVEESGSEGLEEIIQRKMDESMERKREEAWDERSVFEMYTDLHAEAEKSCIFQIRISYTDGEGIEHIIYPEENDAIQVSFEMLDSAMVPADEMHTAESYSLTAELPVPFSDSAASSTYSFVIVRYAARADAQTVAAQQKAWEIINTYADLEYCLTDPYRGEITDAQYKELRQAALSATAGCNTDYEKIKAIVGFVADRIYYDYYYLNHKESVSVYINPYEVYTHKRTVCAGYAKLVRTLLVSIGIPCMDLIGDNHEYNAAYDGQQGKWIFADATWCSRNSYDIDSNGEEVWEHGGFGYNMFDLTLEEIAQLSNHEVYGVDGLVDGTRNSAYYSLSAPEDNWAQMDWHMEISGIKNPKADALTAQSMLAGFPVTKVKSWAFANRDDITGGVVLPEGVKEIGSYAFYNCTGMSGTLTLPASLTTIEEWAFANCSSLRGGLALSAERIGDCAFYNCSSLNGALTLAAGLKSVGTHAFCNCSGLSGGLALSAESIGDYAFYNCSGLNGTLTLSSGLRSIGSCAFYNCSGLSGGLALSAESIGDYAFYNCSGLNGTLTLPSGLKSIGTKVFYQCSGLKGDLSLPAGLKTIGEGAFSNCSSLTGSLKLPGGLEELGKSAFSGCSGLSGRITLPAGLTSIGEGTFSDCSRLTGNLVLPESLTSIGYGAFSGCSGLTGDLTIPKGVTEIGEWAFSNCKGFNGRLTLPAGLKSIGNCAFYECSGFTGNLTLPAALTSLGEWAFGQCRGLTGKLALPTGLARIENYTFYNCNSLTGELKLPAGLTAIGDSAFFGCSGLTGELRIPSKVKTIGEYAFASYNDSDLDKNIVLEGVVESIGANAFYRSDCSAGNITIYAPEGSCGEAYANNNGYMYARKFLQYDGCTFYKKGNDDVTCRNSDGSLVKNEFKCDGTYTYFFQADGTAMKDRLSYHPDGVHVIYFDQYGHEVFSDFANVKKAIAGNAVDDYCYFDVYGYLYVDVVTYDRTGTVLYYANPYGVLERGKWFQFSDTVKYPGENGLQPWEGAAGGYGYANADGTLMKDQWTYDWEGRLCYMQGNGVALYQ